MDIDDALAAMVARASEPALAAIKLAWWRERLEELDQGAVPAEPRLRAAAAELLPRGIRGADLGELTEGSAALLDESPDAERIGQGGAMLFAIGARLLGASDLKIEPAGRLYGAANAARRGLIPMPSSAPELRFPKGLRPLTALAALAARDARRPQLEPEATPGRSWTLIRHRLTGKI